MKIYQTEFYQEKELNGSEEYINCLRYLSLHLWYTSGNSWRRLFFFIISYACFSKFLSMYSWTSTHNIWFPINVAHLSAALNSLLCIIVKRKDFPDWRMENCSNSETAVMYDWDSTNPKMYCSTNFFAASPLESFVSFAWHMNFPMLINLTSKTSRIFTTILSSWLREPPTISRNNWPARSFASKESAWLVANLR